MMMMMMMLLLKKNLSLTQFIPKTTATFYLLHFSSSSSSATENLLPKSNFITEYLITSCGLSPQKAAIASKSKLIAKLASPSRPNLVRHFFKHHGFTDNQISSIISHCPNIICTDVNKTLQANLDALRQMAFTEHELRRFITCYPEALLQPDIPRLQFWKTLLNGNTKHLLYGLMRNQGLLHQDIKRGIIPKIALLKEHGLSDADIEMLVVRGQRFITRGVSSMEALLRKAQELGFCKESPMFVQALSVLSSVGSDNFKEKMELLNGFGWSEREFLAALQKHPYVIKLSAENIREKIEFLVGRAGCTQSYIASRPLLLGLSLEKRLMPRHHVMNILKLSKSAGREMSLYSVMSLSEKNFVERIILRNKEQVAMLHDAYIAACAGKISL